MDYFKVFTEFVTILLLFFLGGGLRGMGDLSSPIELAAPALEVEVLTTGPPMGEDSHVEFLKLSITIVTNEN